MTGSVVSRLAGALAAASIVLIVTSCGAIQREPAPLLDAAHITRVVPAPAGRGFGDVTWLVNSTGLVVSAVPLGSPHPELYDLFETSADGRGFDRLPLPTAPGCDYTPNYLPRRLGDDRLGFIQDCWRTEKRALMVYSLQTGRVARFLPYDLPGAGGPYSFAPDGHLGMINDSVGLREQLWWLGPDRASPTQFPFRRAGTPNWSPDGKLIVLDGAPSTPVALPWNDLLFLTRTLYRYTVETGQLTALFGGFFDTSTAAWSPDGQWLILPAAYNTATDNARLLLVSVATGRACRLAPVGWYGAVDWSPDGRAIAIATLSAEDFTPTPPSSGFAVPPLRPNTLYIFDATRLEQRATQACLS